ncbi:MAG: hypothetical protein AB1918_05555 [Pseudomonadota bacterium]
MRPKLTVVIATINFFASLTLFAIALDPFLGMSKFPFPCEPCGWKYDSKLIYFSSFSIPAVMLFIGAVGGLRSRNNNARFSFFILLSALGYISAFLP